jgi:hypothetical protein
MKELLGLGFTRYEFHPTTILGSRARPWVIYIISMQSDQIQREISG